VVENIQTPEFEIGGLRVYVTGKLILEKVPEEME